MLFNGVFEHCVSYFTVCEDSGCTECSETDRCDTCSAGYYLVDNSEATQDTPDTCPGQHSHNIMWLVLGDPGVPI